MNYYNRTKESYPHLTKGLKRIAEALLANPIMFATYSAKKNAETLDVSETMVVRFCKAIGYHGYREFQLDVQHSLLSLKLDSDELFKKKENSFESIMNVDAQNILQASSNIDWNIVEQIVEALIKAKEINVVGYYHSFSYAHWFSFILNSLLTNTSLYRPETDIGIIKKGKEHCVVIFSFYRYAIDSIRVAEEAKENGNTVIIITDSMLSPICHLGDYVLSIQIAQKSMLEKSPVTFSLLNSILLHLAKRMEKVELVNPINKYYIK
ncbi:MurR/RpiR family transcriptional regulator [Peribacillus frigoritolerans]|uniref:MurR/RpiR family transcriptional regulator n=1 Tax=Peribacillus frigoritolerans TaxID=450367 RepID=UPI003F8162E9